jgi:serine/threonine protein kinase/tetratricopeptide (TPR) repeat protein
MESLPDSDSRLQTTLADHYRIERELGRGGMATVYLAEDIKHHRQVAIKVLHSHLAQQLGSDRFLREIQIAARLNHPHILTLIDSGESGGFLYFVMPYVEGESLRDRLRRQGKLPVDEALAIARDVAGALGYAHQRGVVHRDIKPENLMLHEGGAIVTDFGIAKAVIAADADSLTQTGFALGTPTYMSPEQAAGGGNVDGKSDIYSLGCVLYEMLTGNPPFSGATAQAVISRRFSEAAPSLPSDGGIPEQVVLAVARSLQREPADRFASAAQFVQALQLTGRSGTTTIANAAGVAPAAAPAGKRIAVLPFTDMSSERDQEYFADGITEEIINALTKIQALQVASRSSAFAFKGKSIDIRRIGEQLNATTVLEGSVRKAGKRLRVTAQLISTADGYHLWSERYDRDMEDIFAVQDDIAERVAETLRIVLTEDERRAIEVTPAADVRAYDYYLRGRELVSLHRRTAYQHAIEMFTRAIEIDPAYARAYAGLADCHALLYHYLEASQTNLQKADEMSRKALELDPNSPEAHASRGHALSLGKRFPEARAEFETSIRLAPTLFESHYLYARACWAEGLMEEAAHHFEEAIRVRQEDYQAPALLASIYDGLGRRDKGDEARRHTVRVTRRQLELYPTDVRALYLGACVLLQLGEKEEANRWAREALENGSDDPAVYYNLACFYGIDGDAEKAMECLEKAVEYGFAHREWLQHDVELRLLHGLPRYRALLERLK